MRSKIIVIVGPTSSGKTGLSIDLAKQFDGEVVSADSRQVYRGLDVGSGKVTPDEMEGIPHHLLDVADPQERYSVADFKQDAEKAIDDILTRDKLPVIAGGTGFYIQAIVDNITPPEVPPNEKLRADLEELSSEVLLEKLKQLDPNRAATIEQENSRRLIRAIEIAKAIGTTPPLDNSDAKYDALQIGIEWPKEALRERIHARLLARINNEGMIEEVQKLHAGGLSFARMEELGLEYRYLARLLQGQLSQEAMISELNNKIWQYAKRQMTWFKRDDRIHWFPGDALESVPAFVTNFLI